MRLLYFVVCAQYALTAALAAIGDVSRVGRSRKEPILGTTLRPSRASDWGHTTKQGLTPQEER